MKRFYIAIIILLGGMQAAFAAYPQGACGTPSGSQAATFNYAFNYSITSPADNTPGHIVGPLMKTAPGYFSLICSCNFSENFWTYQWTTTLLTEVGRSGSLTFYSVNDKLSVATETKEPTYGYWIPFPMNGFHDPVGPGAKCNQEYGGYSLGNDVRLTARIEKPFVGQSIIPNTQIAQIWYTVGPTFIKGSPVVSIYLSGEVTVPQNCTIDAGQTISVDLGTMMSSSFKTTGQKPDGFTDKTFNVPVRCTNTNSASNLTLRLTATTASGNSNAIASNNTDVGVVVTSEFGNVLKPNQSSGVPFNVDSSGNATVTLKAYPISTTGKQPKEGAFSALATLVVDFA